MRSRKKTCRVRTHVGREACSNLFAFEEEEEEEASLLRAAEAMAIARARVMEDDAVADPPSTLLAPLAPMAIVRLSIWRLPPSMFESFCL